MKKSQVARRPVACPRSDGDRALPCRRDERERIERDRTHRLRAAGEIDAESSEAGRSKKRRVAVAAGKLPEPRLDVAA